MEIDQIYPLPSQETNPTYKEPVSYNRTNSPIYQNTSESANLPRTSQDTTPIYSNTNVERFRTTAPGMSYGESLAHHLRYSMGRSDNTQGNINMGMILETKLYVCF